ncbi:unnamed protein product [Choristocarpus tenellus]
MEFGGKHIRVDCAAGGGVYDHIRTVFVGNLPMDSSDEEVRALFVSKLEAGDSAVEGVRLVRDKSTLVGKGIGYILLADRALAAKALQLHGTKLRKRLLRVMPCGKRTKGRGGRVEGREDARPEERTGPAEVLSKKRRKSGSFSAEKFASFEGRRSVPDGFLRRLKNKKGFEAASSVPAKRFKLSGQHTFPARGVVSFVGDSRGGRGRRGRGRGPSYGPGRGRSPSYGPGRGRGRGGREIRGRGNGFGLGRGHGGSHLRGRGRGKGKGRK